MMRASALVMIMMSMLCSSEAMADGYDESQLDRLFTTSSQRQAMDRLRDSGQGQAQQQSAKSSPGTVTVNGIVRRSDGRSTVWVNGKDTRERSLHGVRVPSKQGRQDKVTVYVDGRQVRIKPGESWSDADR